MNCNHLVYDYIIHISEVHRFSLTNFDKCIQLCSWHIVVIEGASVIPKASSGCVLWIEVEALIPMCWCLQLGPWGAQPTRGSH